MRLGFVSYWFPRGQATVTRFIKSIFDEAGHKTYVLARRGNLAKTEGDWKEANLTIGPNNHDISFDFYKKWIVDNELDAVFFFQNYQFEEIFKIKEMGVQTIGTFMWEQFGERHTADAKKAYSKIYSLHKKEKLRYEKFGIKTKLIRWGIHPSLKIKTDKYPDNITFHFPCGYNSPRKGTELLVKAFNKVENPDIRLVISQANKRPIKINKDSRITIHQNRIPIMKDFLKESSRCHAYIIPSKWEGLGMAFLEAIAMGRPIITTDAPPMSDYVIHKKTGLLVSTNINGKTGSKLDIHEVNINSMANAIKFMSNDSIIKRMSDNTIKHRKEYDWGKTRKDVLKLIS